MNYLNKGFERGLFENTNRWDIKRREVDDSSREDKDRFSVTERSGYQSNTQRNKASDEQKDNQKKTSVVIPQRPSLNNSVLQKLEKPDNKKQVGNLTDQTESQQDMNVLINPLLSQIPPSSENANQRDIKRREIDDSSPEDLDPLSNFRPNLSFFKERLSGENSRDIKSRNTNQPDIKRRGLDNSSKKEENGPHDQPSVQKRLFFQQQGKSMNDISPEILINSEIDRNRSVRQPLRNPDYPNLSGNRNGYRFNGGNE